MSSGERRFSAPRPGARQCVVEWDSSAPRVLREASAEGAMVEQEQRQQEEAKLGAEMLEQALARELAAVPEPRLPAFFRALQLPPCTRSPLPPLPFLPASSAPPSPCPKSAPAIPRWLSRSQSRP